MTDLADWTVELAVPSTPTADLPDWTWADTGSGGGGGGGGSLPVTGYSSWYDASQITGLADGAAVSSWPDLSGGGNPLTQATGARQPAYYSTTSANLVNGKPTVFFNGGQYLQGGFTLPQPFTFFVVLAYQGSPALQQIVWMTSAGLVSLCPRSPAPSWPWGIYANSGPATVNGGSTTASPTLLSGVYQGSSSFLHQDRVNVGGPGVAIGTLGFAANFWLGIRNDLTLGFNGPMCEIVFYPFVLSAGSITSVENYLATKWGTP